MCPFPFVEPPKIIPAPFGRGNGGLSVQLMNFGSFGKFPVAGPCSHRAPQETGPPKADLIRFSLDVYTR